MPIQMRCGLVEYLVDGTFQPGNKIASLEDTYLTGYIHEFHSISLVAY
jgi:hypothetical protein